ncbi:MAG: hypothetical protein HY962_08030 [Ignavibacteriae bacterium]|nr:hypothetical protein [Ignavibacteriota bacterium]
MALCFALRCVFESIEGRVIFVPYARAKFPSIETVLRTAILAFVALGVAALRWAPGIAWKRLLGVSRMANYLSSDY